MNGVNFFVRTVAYNADQLQGLQNALASGELEVTFQGRKTIYRSIAELESAISTVTTELAKASGAAPVRRVKTFMDDEDDRSV